MSPLAAAILGDSLIYIVLPASVAELGVTDTFGLSQAFWIGLALSANRFIQLASNSFAARTYRSLRFRGRSSPQLCWSPPRRSPTDSAGECSYCWWRGCSGASRIPICGWRST